MSSAYFRERDDRIGGREGKGKERESNVLSEVKQEDEGLSGVSSETVLTKSEKPSKKLARWRHVMEVPENGNDAEKLWSFVAAHVEDKWRKKPCFLAQKAWKLLTSKAMVGYKPRRGGETEGIPVAMPGRLASWRRRSIQSGVDWSEKYVRRSCGEYTVVADVGVYRSYTARDLECHYIRCGHRMSAEESGRVLGRVDGKYERNPMVGVAEKKRRIRCAQKRRDWETRGMYPEAGQLLMEEYVRRAREKEA